jgi:hypothetical protein
MALPQLRDDGTLPIGEHVATWPEIKTRFGGTEARTALLGGLLAVLVELQRVGCRTAWIDGSFVTSKPEPNDFDMCWDETGVDEAALDPVFFDFADKRAAQKAKYGGEIFPAGAVADALQTTFREFFQQKYGVAKGIVRIHF